MESEEAEGIDAASKIWGNLPNKEQMQVLGIDGPSAGSNKRHKPEEQKKKKDTRSNSEASTTVPDSLLAKLTKLVLRHEDSINVMLQESEFILHLNPGKGSVLPLLLQTSRTWHQNRQDRKMPLRHLLSLSTHHDANIGGQDKDPHGGCTDGRLVSRLCSVPFGGQQSGSDNAVPTLGQSASLPSTDGSSRHSDRGGLQECLQHSEADGRQQRDAAVPCPSKDAGGTASSDTGSLAVDSQSSKQPGASAAIGCLVASRHLAAHPSEIEATDADSTATGNSDPEGPLRFGIVRLFLNPTGRACAANSVIACLAWMMLLAEGFIYELWHSGFELMRNVVACNLIPLDLLRHDPFGWLLTGEWSIERFLELQQDASEFCAYLLNFTRPRFLNCHWDVRLSFADGLDSVHLAHEKGSQSVSSHQSKCPSLIT